MKESKVQSDVREWAEERGCIVVKPHEQYHVNFPDRIFFLPNGRTVCIEFKATGKRPNDGQARKIRKLGDLNQYVVWSDNAEYAILCLKQVMAVPAPSRLDPMDASEIEGAIYELETAYLKRWEAQFPEGGPVARDLGRRMSQAFRLLRAALPGGEG